MRRVIAVLAPLIMLLFAWVLASRAELAGDASQSLILVIPYVIALLAIFMRVWYQNSNSFYLICFILISYIFISTAQPKPPMLEEVVTMVGILLPVNIVWLAFSKERGIFSSYGRNKSLVIFGELIWIFINMMGKSSVPAVQDIGQSYIDVKVPALVLYILGTGLLLTCYILKRNYMDIIYVSVLITSFISLYFANRILLVAVFTSAIFAIMVIAMFDISYSLAFYDTLTGVLSRRALEQETLKLGNKKYAVAIVDLDHFKKINDYHGHDVGDEVLKMVASVLGKTAGRAKVFRYGGEEFVVLFVGTPYNDVMTQLEKMRKAIERRPFVVRSDSRPSEKPKPGEIKPSTRGKGTVKVTVSIGLAQKTSLLKTCYDVIRKADEALYKSKNSGRNCITKI